MRIFGMKLHNHDCSLAEIDNERIIDVIEFERISKERYHFENFFESPQRLSYWFNWYSDYREDKTPADIVVLDRIIYEDYHRRLFKLGGLLPKIRAELLRNGLITARTQFHTCWHHEGHAHGAFYTSPFEEAMILSFDGAGDDGYTNMYYADKDGIRLVRKYPYWLGRIYKSQKDLVEGLRYSRKKGGEEAVAGKLMALAAYGKKRPEWHPLITNYIKNFHTLGTRVLEDPLYHREKAGILEELREPVPLESELSLDWLCNFQRSWTDVVKEIVETGLKELGTRNLCLTGGCALNCVANYDISEELGLDNIYVPPNPNDTGLSLGFAYSYLYKNKLTAKRERYPVSPYRNCRILDSFRPQSGIKSRAATLKQVADHIAAGKIVATLIGSSEMGPRALGNRSILCDPSIDGMKDTLNAKVKFREHFRPFAPIVRLEDYREYFDCRCESPYMSFAARVRPEYRTKLKEIVHVDGTARLQTVRRETNPTIWELLKIYKQDHGLGVLLNTSFNIKGKPILTTYEDAFDVLKNTLLDYVFDGEFLYWTERTERC